MQIGSKRRWWAGVAALAAALVAVDVDVGAALYANGPSVRRRQLVLNGMNSAPITGEVVGGARQLPFPPTRGALTTAPLQWTGVMADGTRHTAVSQGWYRVASSDGLGEFVKRVLRAQVSPVELRAVSGALGARLDPLTVEFLAARTSDDALRWFDQHAASLSAPPFRDLTIETLDAAQRAVARFAFGSCLPIAHVDSLRADGYPTERLVVKCSKVTLSCDNCAGQDDTMLRWMNEALSTPVGAGLPYRAVRVEEVRAGDPTVVWQREFGKAIPVRFEFPLFLAGSASHAEYGVSLQPESP